jgi:UDP-N-acetylmuramoyl-tripeptide--D-alanyl-D-alanine ligase
LASSALVVLLASLWWWRGERFYVRWLLESPGNGSCQKRLSRPVLDASIQLGTRFLLAHQRPEGNFDYEYDWREKQLSNDDQETRQVGALWGLTLLYQEDKRPQLASAIERALSFFDEHSREVKGVRCLVYPGSRTGRAGTIALMALSQIEYLRAASDLAADERQLLEARLDQYLKMLTESRHPSGLWYGDYDVKTCKPQGEPSSYSDGEALLALVKAAKYLGKRELLPTIMSAAAAGKRINIDEALAENADSDVTKGYYQWSSMAFYELATSDFPDVSGYGDTVLTLADWMIDVHKVLIRTRNTGYAYEGIIHAYALAKQRHDSARQAKYGCVIDLGLEHIMTWQVGGPLTNRFTASASADDAQALGGVQNAAFEPALRVDVTQHQMHATQLARQYVY